METKNCVVGEWCEFEQKLERSIKLIFRYNEDEKKNKTGKTDKQQDKKQRIMLWKTPFTVAAEYYNMKF